MRYFLFSILYLLSSLYNMSSGDCTVTPGYEFAGDQADRVTKSKLNLGFNPMVRVNEAAIGPRELTPEIGNIVAYAGIKNALLNPLFDFSTMLPGDGPDTAFLGGTGYKYCVDRWVIDLNAYWSRVKFPLGQTDVPDSPVYYLHWPTSAAQEAISLFGQRIAGVRSFAGREVTFAIYVRADQPVTVQLQLSQYFGSGGSPSAPVTTTAQNYTLVAGVWTKLVYTVDVPTSAGKVIGTNGNDWLEARVIMPQDLYFEIDFARAQLQLGNNADNFEHRITVLEAALCNIFFERTQAVLASDVTTHYPCFYFNTGKRRTPDLILFDPSEGSGATIQQLSINGFYQDTANSQIGISSVTANAELYP